jgi:membrane AbrB-like protein
LLQTPALLLRYILTLAWCLAGASLFVYLGTPLPWMLGALAAMAIASTCRLPVLRPPGIQQVGQLVIGSALGLYFTPPVLKQLAHYAPFVLGAAIFSFVLGVLCAAVLVRLSGSDFRTAFFASLPGGVVEMAVLADRLGGRAERVAAAHAVRVILVVTSIPLLLAWSGVHGVEQWMPATSHGVDYGGLLLMGGLTAGAALILRKCNMPNNWVIGPLLAMVLVTGMNIELSTMPRWATNTAQVLIGCTLGGRFNAAFFRSAPRFLGSVVVSVCLAMLLAAGFAWALAAISGINLPTMILATAPGGVAEMSITAQALHFGVPVVVAFHVVRMAFLVLATAPLVMSAQRYLRWRHSARMP